MQNSLIASEIRQEQIGTFSPGSVVGGTYRLIRRIGQGGMGVLFLAAHERIPGNCVLKTLPTECRGEEAAIEGLRQEAMAMGTVQHPNIVRLLDFNEADNGLPYLVMEYLPGVDLSAISTQPRLLTIRRVASVIRQVALGLHAAHRVGVVHQDLKPSNIMVVPTEDEEDLVKIIDFGISKKVHPCNLLGDGDVTGTPPFIAPEQVVGGEVGTACDQFALAVTSYSLLTGRPPWRENTDLALLYSVVNRDPLPMEDPKLRRVEPVLRRGMAKNPNHRFPSVMDFWKAFSQSLTNELSSPESPGPTSPSRLGATRRFGLSSWM